MKRNTNKENWFVIWLLVAPLSALVIFNLVKNSWIINPEILALIAFICFLIILVALKPAKLSTSFGSLERDVEAIKKNLRDYVILNASGVIYSTFNDDNFQLIHNDLDQDTNLKFSFKEMPLFVEVRHSRGSSFHFTMTEVANRFEYLAELSSGYDDPNSVIIIEAFHVDR